MPLETPIAFLIFNRPDVTAKVFQEIARARPKRLLIVADGPRNADEAEQCKATRAVVDAVDWPCEVLTNYADENMGLRRRISSGLDWVFQECEEAIILEDDCLPDPSFFPCCVELLARYRDEPRVMMISGNYFHGSRRLTENSYYFSRYTHIWGWATWRRAWKHYDPMMASWPRVSDQGGWPDPAMSEQERGYWAETFRRTHSGEIDAWSFQWQYALWEQQAYAVLPAVNLICNIGFGAGATHTRQVTDMANLPTIPLSFPLRHPERIEPLGTADALTFARVFAPKPPAVQERIRGVAARVYRRLRRVAGLRAGRQPNATDNQKPFRGARAYYRALRLMRRLPPDLSLALARLEIWPAENAFDPETGWLNLPSFGLDIRSEGRTLLARADGLTFEVEAIEDLYTLRDVLIEKIYAELSDLNFNGDTCVWDIGMNLGAASLFFAKQDRVNAVYGYEPFAHTFALALRAMRFNADCSAKIKAFQFGVGRADQSVLASYTTDWKASAQTEPVSVTDMNGAQRKGKRERIRIVDAATVLQQIRDENPHAAIVAKIDCEGAEYPIVQRLVETGKLSDLAAADIECHSEPDEVERAFSDAGFETVRRPTATPGYVIVTARRRSIEPTNGA